MLRRLAAVTLFALLALSGCASAPGASNLTVRTTGDARVYGVYTANRHFTGWH